MVITIPRTNVVAQRPHRTCDVGSVGATAYATGRLMGTSCQVRATGPNPREALSAVDVAWEAVAECERLWSRFLNDSELTLLNKCAMAAPFEVGVSDLTADLIAAMLWAYTYSEGWVDASLLPQIVAAGYDRDFDELDTVVPPPRNRLLLDRYAGMSAVSLAGNRLMRSKPVLLDSGGVGKGLAADLVAESIVRGGASGALVDLGGDIRAIGTDQHDRPWLVTAANEANPESEDVGSWNVTDAGIATSSKARRRWQGGHHLIDPHTGRPSTSDLLAVAVVSSDALVAEVSAKSALLMGQYAAVDWLRERGATAILTGLDGTLTRVDRESATSADTED